MGEFLAKLAGDDFFSGTDEIQYQFEKSDALDLLINFIRVKYCTGGDPKSPLQSFLDAAAAAGPAQMLLQHPTRFDNVPVLTAEDIHMSSLDDDGEGYKLTLEDYCLLTVIVLCIAYLIYKLYNACMARREANENEEGMLAQATELSQDPQVHEVVVGQRIVTVPVQHAGQQKIVTIQMPHAQANAVSAVQGNAMPRGTDMSQASSQAAGCPNMFGN